MNIIPNVLTHHSDQPQICDIYSKLLNDRIIFIDGEINDTTASVVIASLLYLESLDSQADISLYINSPGGSVSAGLAIYDTMNYIQNDVATVCVGMAASMGAVLLAAGTKGKRFALPNSEVMLHQIMGTANGQASDVQIAVNHLLRKKKDLQKLLSELTGQPERKIAKDIDRDFFMDARQAKAYHLIDEILEKKRVTNHVIP